MGYLYLSIALFAGCTKGFCGKKMGNSTKNIQSAILINLVRMALCVLFGFAMILFLGQTKYISPKPELIIISMISGISTSIFVTSWLMVVKKSAYMLVDIALMLGTLVPMIAGFFSFGEAISLKEWIGYFFLICATLIMFLHNNSIKTKLGLSTIIYLAVCGLANGVTSYSQKMFVYSCPEIPASVFNMYTYIFAAITLFIFSIVGPRKEKPQFEDGAKHKYIYILIMSVALIMNSLFITKAAHLMDSAQLFPLNNAMALILSSVMASVFFKERMTIKCIAGMVIAFMGLIIMNIL